MKKKNKKKKFKKLFIIEKPAYIDGKKTILLGRYKEVHNKFTYYCMKIYCKFMGYDYEIV